MPTPINHKDIEMVEDRFNKSSLRVWQPIDPLPPIYIIDGSFLYESSYVDNPHLYGSFGFSFEQKESSEDCCENAFDLIKKQTGWSLRKNTQKVQTFKTLGEALDYLYPTVSVWLENFQD